MITYLLDKIRITTGDSECPLYNKCSGADEENDTCVSNRGRVEIGFERAPCYKLFKSQIRSQKQGLISGLARKIMEGLLHMEGLDD